LRECVGIPVKEFGLVVTLENGEERTFSSISLAPYRQRFFTGDFYSRYRRAVRKANTDDAYSSSGESHLNSNVEKPTDSTVSRIWSR
jgi:hypothetical protein